MATAAERFGSVQSGLTAAERFGGGSQVASEPLVAAPLPELPGQMDTGRRGITRQPLPGVTGGSGLNLVTGEEAYETTGRPGVDYSVGRPISGIKRAARDLAQFGSSIRDEKMLAPDPEASGLEQLARLPGRFAANYMQIPIDMATQLPNRFLNRPQGQSVVDVGEEEGLGLLDWARKVPAQALDAITLGSRPRNPLIDALASVGGQTTREYYDEALADRERDAGAGMVMGLQGGVHALKKRVGGRPALDATGQRPLIPDLRGKKFRESNLIPETRVLETTLEPDLIGPKAEPSIYRESKPQLFPERPTAREAAQVFETELGLADKVNRSVVGRDRLRRRLSDDKMKSVERESFTSREITRIEGQITENLGPEFVGEIRATAKKKRMTAQGYERALTRFEANQFKKRPVVKPSVEPVGRQPVQIEPAAGPRAKVGEPLKDYGDIWRMTRKEYLAEKPRGQRRHKAAVKQAISNNDLVPNDVLVDYPELVTKVKVPTKQIKPEGSPMKPLLSSEGAKNQTAARKIHFENRQNIEAAKLSYKDKLKLFTQNNNQLQAQIGRLLADKAPKGKPAKKPVKSKEPWEMTKEGWREQPSHSEVSGVIPPESSIAPGAVERTRRSLKGKMIGDLSAAEQKVQLQGAQVSDGLTRVYRAGRSKIRPGDFVTTSKNKAEGFAKSKGFASGGEIYSHKVRVADLWAQNPNDLLWLPSEFHKTRVETAIKQGKPVPASVLKDYPDLAKKAKPLAKAPIKAVGRAERVRQAEISRVETLIQKHGKEGDLLKLQNWKSKKGLSDIDYIKSLQKLEDRFNETGSFKKPEGFVSSEAAGGAPEIDMGGLPRILGTERLANGKIKYTLSNGGIIKKQGDLYGIYEYRKPGGKLLKKLGKAKSLREAIKIAGGVAGAAGITAAVVSQMSEEEQKQAIESGKGITAAGLGAGAFLAFAKGPKVRKAAEAKIKSTARPVFEEFMDYSESIRVNPFARNLIRSVLGPNHPLPGIAMRRTSKPKPEITGQTQKRPTSVPSIRRSGIFVERAVQDYTKFKDIPSTWTNTMDPTRAIQGIDGALSLKEKVAQGGSGPIERNVLWRTRDLVKMRARWLGEKETRGREMLKGLKDKDLVAITKEVEFPGSSSRPDITRKGQAIHQLYEEMIREQNDARIMRHQKPIPYRKGYSPHVIREATIWDRGYGVLNTVADVFKKGTVDNPALPDFIRPNKLFNPRELARRAGMGEFSREMRADKLLEGYINTAARDIFNTTIIENNKAFAQQLESMDLPKAAAFIQDWTAEGFAGVTGRIDRAFMVTAGGKVAPNLRKAMRGFRKSLVLGTFPLNVGWNLAIQTGSAAFTVPKYGVRNTAMGMYDWFTNKGLRQEIRDNAYSYIIKNRGKGRMATQDINRGMAASARINKSKLDKVTEVASLLSDVVENNLTGFSVAAARRHGQAAGLKGQALWEYASDGGAKTQSMYNLEDLPGLLRNEIVKTTSPFQTFKFEAYNNMKEWAGRAGVSPENHRVRTKQLVEFLGAAMAGNMVTSSLSNREPWGPDSFVPIVYDMIAGPAWAAFTGDRSSYVSKRGLPAPTGVAIDFASGVHDVITKGKWDRLRKASTRYLPGVMGVPGGTQVNRMIDAWIANAQGGVKSGTQVFPITGTKEKVRSYLYGPWSTENAQAYLKKNEKTWLQAFGFKDPTVLQALGLEHNKFTGAVGLTKQQKKDDSPSGSKRRSRPKRTERKVRPKRRKR